MSCVNTLPTIYLLFGGTSEDGRGNPEYIGCTTDKVIAKNTLRAAGKIRTAKARW